MKYLIVGLVGIVLGASGFLLFTNKSTVFGNAVSGGAIADACTASTSVETIVSTGSTVIAATSSNRAYAQITELAPSNRAALSLNYGAAVTATNYYQTPSASTTAQVGLATNFPYTGAILASSTSGSATILVTTCSY